VLNDPLEADHVTPALPTSFVTAAVNGRAWPTVSPPRFGLIATLMFAGVTVRFVALVPVPAVFVTLIFPVAAPAGTVALKDWGKGMAADPLKMALLKELGSVTPESKGVPARRARRLDFRFARLKKESVRDFEARADTSLTAGCFGLAGLSRVPISVPNCRGDWSITETSSERRTAISNEKRESQCSVSFLAEEQYPGA